MGWNSLLETMRSQSGSEDPLSDLARQNELLKAKVMQGQLDDLSEANKKKEIELEAREKILESRKAFLDEPH